MSCNLFSFYKAKCSWEVQMLTNKGGKKKRTPKC